MMLDDIIYVGLLIGLIGFGNYFRYIKNPVSKQWISSGVGFFVSLIVSGWDILHPIIMTIICAAIISQLSPRIRHTTSFFFSFFYLLIISRLTEWYGLPEISTHTNLILMLMTLKYGAMGFELNSVLEELKTNPDIQCYKAMKNISFLDVVHYGWSYMGILTGPFYRYRTYWDCINRKFSDYIECWEPTLYKLKLIGVSTVIFLLTNHIYPNYYVLTEEFQERPFWYRLWYIYPSFLIFRTRLYIGMMFSECVCQMAGLGVYPVSSEPRSGLGPKDYKAAEQIALNPEKIKEEKMDFETVYNIDLWGVEKSYLVRTAMKRWNITVQYWMANYVYKVFPWKNLRAAATFFVSTIWHGYAFGYFVGIFSVVLFLPIEDTYVKFYTQSKENSLARKGWWCFLWFLRFNCMAYLSFGFQLLNFGSIYIYYKSVYFVGHILAVLLYIIGRTLKPYLITKTESQKL
ncbi:lysophospholipid acyltransferase 7 [Microplitis mediator]|uniref:lysophospholipid acyltransferase 7 n=1 Tax=Microplitis mediator TaxID=375433 RepID=UPI0025543BA9|nr:lysophospholipid acyltransferase 7 [Microplitis mediator]